MSVRYGCPCFDCRASPSPMPNQDQAADRYHHQVGRGQRHGRSGAAEISRPVRGQSRRRQALGRTQPRRSRQGRTGRAGILPRGPALDLRTLLRAALGGRPLHQRAARRRHLHRRRASQFLREYHPVGSRRPQAHEHPPVLPRNRRQRADHDRAGAARAASRSRPRSSSATPSMSTSRRRSSRRSASPSSTNSSRMASSRRCSRSGRSRSRPRPKPARARASPSTIRLMRSALMPKVPTPCSCRGRRSSRFCRSRAPRSSAARVPKSDKLP